MKTIFDMSMRSERKQINNERKRVNKGRMINRDILQISIFFVVLFFALMVYMGYFLTFRASAVINNTYNKRSETIKKTVRRGAIYDADGNTLAYSETGEDGDENRFYPYGNVFAHTVGFEAFGGLGLESSYNYYLLSSHTSFFEKISNEVNHVKNPGDSIHTSLRADLQTYISNLFGETMGGVIALDPATGQVKAMVSKPDFDPNTVSDYWDEIIADEERSPLLNRVTQGKYTPGSTFKMFTMLEYLRENPDFMDYTYDCEGRIKGPNYEIKCNDGEVHGHEDSRAAFAASCNCAFANMALYLDRKEWIKNNEKMLFGSDLGIDLAFNESAFRLAEDASDFMVMQTGFGQGETSTNPLHLSLVMSAFANNGVLMKPHLVTKVTSESGQTVKTFGDVRWKTLCTPAECESMNEYLRAVVTEGTANGLNWDSYTAYGKTGTAETLSNKNENYDRSWFVGYGELNGEKLVLCVIVDNMNESPMKAVDFAGEIFSYYFNH